MLPYCQAVALKTPAQMLDYIHLHMLSADGAIAAALWLLRAEVKVTRVDWPFGRIDSQLRQSPNTGIPFSETLDKTQVIPVL